MIPGVRLPPGIPHRRAAEIGLIPLINVVFLLLVFFMIAGRIGPPDGLDVEPPGARAAAPASAASGASVPPVLVLAADGRLALDGAVVAEDGLASALAARVADGRARPVGAPAGARTGRVEAAPVGPAAGPPDPGTAPGRAPASVVLKADAAAPLVRVRAVLAVLGAAGVARVELRTVPLP